MARVRWNGQLGTGFANSKPPETRRSQPENPGQETGESHKRASPKENQNRTRRKPEGGRNKTRESRASETRQKPPQNPIRPRLKSLTAANRIPFRPIGEKGFPFKRLTQSSAAER